MDDPTALAIMSLLQRIKTRLEKLDDVFLTLPKQMEIKRKERSEWQDWHAEWKNAWVTPPPELTETEKEKLRLQTSVTNRYKSLDY
jgi:hypothetical protein